MCTIFLSWYSQNSNNKPYLNNSLHIISHNRKIYLKYQHTYLYKKKLVLAAPEITAKCDLFYSLPKNWELLAGKLCFDSVFETTPPSSWSFINSCDSSVIPSKWPQPLISNQARTNNNILKKIYPFNDNRFGFEITFGPISCLIIDGNIFPCSSNEKTMYKEYFECIILTESDSLLLDSIRSSLRPRFLISISDNKSNLSRFSNVIHLDKIHSEIIFRVTTRNTLKLK